MTTGTISLRKLAHLLDFVGKMDRPILQAVRLRADGSAVATNGHVLAIYQRAHNLGRDLSLIVPRWLRHKLGAVARKVGEDHVQIRQLEDRLMVIDAPFGPVACTIDYDAIYPDVNAVMPTGPAVAIEHIRFQPHYLQLFGSMPTFTFYGSDKAISVSTSDSEFSGLLMPLRPVADTR